MQSLVSLLILAVLPMQVPEEAVEPSWKLPLAEKERIIEANIVERHNILGLYPSQVEVPLDGSDVDDTTLGVGNIAHSVAWTSNYLAGASYRYAFLKKSRAPKKEVLASKQRADEIFDAVYRCQLVTGVKGLLARGYAIGHGESYEERWGDSTKDEWHQGAGRWSGLRWRGSPSHHIYSDCIHGMGQYYDLVAEGEQKERCKEAVDALVSYWVDNDLLIHKLGREGLPVPILGFTDGKTLDTRVMMAIAGAKVAHHVTGKDKFKDTYEKLLDQYGVRDLKVFKAHKDFDDAEHVFCHLENLFRIEKDEGLRRAYRAVADGLWANHKNDAQSLYTYIYYSVATDAEGKEAALKEALKSLQTWPTDMTLKPRMNSLKPNLKPPYAVCDAAWDNEYIWKGCLLNADGWLSRIVTDVAVPKEDPMVIYATDEAGDLYQSRDGAETAAGWHCVDQHLPSPVVAISAAHKVRVLAAACEDGFYLTTTGGYEWDRLSVPEEGGKPKDILFHPEEDYVLYATTTRGAYKSEDWGEEFLGKSWTPLSDGLPEMGEGRFIVAPNSPGHVYALLNGVVFSRSLDGGKWERGERLDIQGMDQYAKFYDWLSVDPSDSSRAIVGLRADVPYQGLGVLSLLRETRDAGKSFSNDLTSLYESFNKGGIAKLLSLVIYGEISPVVIDPKDPDVVYMGTRKGIRKSGDRGKTWETLKAGLDINWVRTVLAPLHSNWLFAGTPAGLYVSEDRGQTWREGHLTLQFQKNTRREIGGAAFIDAYWRGRYYGFISKDTAQAKLP